MSTPTPDWEKLRQSVRGFVGSKVTSAQHADEITQTTMLRLFERAAGGEAWRSAEAAAIEESKWAARAYWESMREDRRNARDAKAALTISRGKRRGPTSTKLADRVGDQISVRLPNAPTGRGRPRKDSPRRRMPALIYYPDGATALLPRRKDQDRYRSKPATDPPSSLVFVVAFCADVPPGPWEPLRLLRQAMDRDRWRDAERAIRSPRKGKR